MTDEHLAEIRERNKAANSRGLVLPHECRDRNALLAEVDRLGDLLCRCLKVLSNDYRDAPTHKPGTRLVSELETELKGAAE